MFTLWPGTEAIARTGATAPIEVTDLRLVAIHTGLLSTEHRHPFILLRITARQHPADIQAPAVTRAPAPLKVLPGNVQKFTEIVRDVQLAMMAFGYYNGELDGVPGPAMRTALSKMQADYGLKVTGTITPETLTALRIAAQ